MLCEQCKMREADIVIREIANGKIKEKRICNKCAAEVDYSKIMGENVPYTGLLSGILGTRNTKSRTKTQEEILHEEKMQEGKLACSGCGMRYDDFVKNGRFGCSECYDTFGILVHDSIRKLQGSDKHIGKRPLYIKIRNNKFNNSQLSQKYESMDEQLKIFKAKQDEAIKKENYEKAAYYRDEIKKIKERMSSGNEVV